MKSIPILSGCPDLLFLVNTQTKEVQSTKLHKLIKLGIGIFLLFRCCPDNCPDPEDPKIGTIRKWYVSRSGTVFHKNDYSDKFIDTNYYKQNKQNDDFELYVTKDRFYKAYGTLPTKTPTDFDKYVTAA